MLQQTFKQTGTKEYTGGKSLESSLKAYYKEFRKVCINDFKSENSTKVKYEELLRLTVGRSWVYPFIFLVYTIQNI